MVGHAALAALLLRTVYPRVGCERRRALTRWWSGKLLSILNVRAEVEGEDAAIAGSIMIAANHVSWLDIFVISSVRPTRFIARGEIRQWPVVGWIADRAGTLFIQRDQWRDIARIGDRVRTVLDDGDCVGLIPEGITTEGDRLLKFHSALFEPPWQRPMSIRGDSLKRRRAALPRGVLLRRRTFMQSLALIIRQRAVIARVRSRNDRTRGRVRRAVGRGGARIASLLGLETADRTQGTASAP